MATSNEQIRDDLIRHQVDVLRFARGLASRLVRLYNASEPAVRQRMRERFEKAQRWGGRVGPSITKRLASIERTYRDLMGDTWKDINSITRKELQALTAIETAAVAASVGASLPVALDLRLPSKSAMRQLVANVPIDGKRLSTWLDQWEENDRARVMQQIRTGMLFDETPIQISRRVFGTRALRGSDGARGITRRGAAAFTNTAVSAISNEVKATIYAANDDVIASELYVATLDSRTTIVCRVNDGKVFDVGTGPRPPLHINCRSLRVPSFDGRALARRPATTATERQLRGLKGEARRDAVEEMVGDVPGDLAGEEWLRRQSAAFQDEVLGSTRGRLFRRGDVSLDRFIDDQGRKYTLPQLRARLPAGAFTRAGLD